MKKILLTVALAVTTTFGANAQNKIYDFSFDGYYSADVGTGTFSGTGLNLLNDGTRPTQFLQTGGATGSSSTPASATLTELPIGLNNRTIAFWHKFSSSEGVMMPHDFFQYGNFKITSSSTITVITGGAGFYMTGYTFPVNTWVHFAVTTSGSAGSVYADGELIGTFTLVSTTSGDFNLGGLAQTALPSTNYNTFDDLKIYDYALTPSEVLQVMWFDDVVNPPVPTEVIAEYNFDNTYNNINGNTPFASNTGTSFVDDRNGNANSAININGTGTTATIPNLPYGGTPRTITLWAKFNAIDPMIDILFAYGTPAASESVLYFDSDGNGIKNLVYAGCNPDMLPILSADVWYHFAFTYDGAVASIYLDGTLFEQHFIPKDTEVDDDTFGLGFFAGQPAFNGAIDELKIFQGALTAAEVSALFNGTGSGVGISEINTNNFVAVYPNPTNSVLNIDVNETANITIVNVLGATVATQTLNAGNNSVDVSNLTNGVYFINNEKGGVVKFIKE